MTDNQLATLSTIVWLIVTTVLFLELANWSAGGSWTIVPGIVRGVRGWVTRGQELDLPPFALSPRGMSPGAIVGPPYRLAGTRAPADTRWRHVSAPRPAGWPTPMLPADPWFDADQAAEIIELDESLIAPARLRRPGR